MKKKFPAAPNTYTILSQKNKYLVQPIKKPTLRILTLESKTRSYTETKKSPNNVLQVTEIGPKTHVALLQILKHM